MRKWLIATLLILSVCIPGAAFAQAVPITDIAARSRLALGISRSFDDQVQFEKDEVGLFYSFGVTKHLNLAANVNYAFNVREDVEVAQEERFRYMVGFRFALGGR